MFLVSIFALFGIFVLNLAFGFYYGFNARHYWFFEMLHFWGGFFMAMFLSNFFESAEMILFGLGTVTFLWELIEFLLAKMPAAARYLKKKFHVKDVMPKRLDTIFDVILNFAGAVLFLYFVR